MPASTMISHADSRRYTTCRSTLCRICSCDESAGHRRGLRNALALGTPSIYSRSPSHHFEHVEHGGAATGRGCMLRSTVPRPESGCLATALFVHLRPPAPSTAVTKDLDEGCCACGFQD